jgi:hypothetical protein
MPLPQPAVPDLGTDNTIDLDKLGLDPLETYVGYPGMADGDQFYPNWRGCTFDGRAGDFFVDRISVDMTQVTPLGMPVPMPNDLLRMLDQGWVFYSYQLYDASQVDGRGEESLRRFFYVGKRAQTGSLLRVAQCKESHDLALDPDGLTGPEATFVTVPYQAMSVGDTVKLTLALFFAIDDPHTTLTFTRVVDEVQLGKPLVWKVPKSELQMIFQGFADVTCRVDYAVPTTPTISATQRFWMIAPVAPLLPAPAIKDFTGGDLDPDAFPEGVTVQIPAYDGLQMGDDLVLYAVSGASLIQSWPADVSTVDSGVLEFHLGHEWLASNNGQSLQLIYQYAREKAAGTGSPLTLTLRKPLNLPAPIVEQATSTGENQGFIAVERVIAGVNITIPEAAVIGAQDKVQMHWQGYGDIGSAVVDPVAGDPRRFQIRPDAVPANIGRRVDVLYKVTPPGGSPTPSSVFDLEVRAPTGGWPTLQIVEPPLNAMRLSLSSVTARGVQCLLESWMFMAQGQRIRIRISGLKPDGQQTELDLRPGDEEQVTEDEYYAGEVWSVIPLAFLNTLKINENLLIDVGISFDLGDSYLPFPGLNVTLVD